jgi:hypothetical protein
MMEQTTSAPRPDLRERGGVFVVSKTQPAHCGPANQILSEDVQQWLRRGLGCIAGRREFLSNRYFAVDVRQLSDVVVGWRHFMGALERREAVACLYNLSGMLTPAACQAPGVRGAVTQLAEIMSVLSDESPEDLASGGRLNLVLNAICPVTGCRTTFFDFDAIAFVPQATDESDPLYDPLMAAPAPLVNVSSDIFGFSMFTWDHCRSRFDCEVRQLTAKERRYLFSVTTESWQKMAEQTITNYSRSVNQRLCPTRLAPDKESWIANHQDPAFAEMEKRSYVHEMPRQYTPRIVQIWQSYFEDGVPPRYKGVSIAGNAVPARCPAAVHL